MKQKTGKATCSICGPKWKSLRDWIRGDNNTVLCGFCYRNFLFPDINDNYTEMLDENACSIVRPGDMQG